MLFNKNDILVFFFQVLFPFLPVLTLGFLQDTEPFASFLKFSSLKVHCDEIWGRAKLWPSATTGFIHFMQLYLSCLTYFRRINPSWRGQGCDPCAKLLAPTALHTNSTKEKLVKCANVA